MFLQNNKLWVSCIHYIATDTGTAQSPSGLQLTVARWALPLFTLLLCLPCWRPNSACCIHNLSGCAAHNDLALFL